MNLIIKKYLKDKNLKELIQGGSISFIFRIGGLIMGYILTLLIAKLFGAEGLGEYVLAVTVLRLFVLIAKLGFDTTSIRFLASFVIQKKWDSIHFFRRKVIFILIITSIISSICMYLFSEDLGLLLSLDYKYIRLNSFFVLPMVFFMLHYQSLRGLKRIGDFSFFYRMSQSLFSIIAIVVLYQFISDDAIPIYAYLISLLIVSALSFVSFQYHYERKKRGEISAELKILNYSTLFKISIPLMFAQSVQFIMAWTDKLMLGVMATSQEVGIYHTAFKLSMFAAIALMSVNSITSPKIAELYAKNDLNQVKNVAQSSTKIIFWLTLPLLVLFFTFPTFFLGLFGSEFKLGVTAFLILSVGRLVSSFSGSVGNILQMTNNQNYFAGVLFLGAIINIVLNLVLIPSSSPLAQYGYSGINGAAIASMMSLIFWNISMVLIVKKKLGFYTFYFPFIRK